MFQNNNNAIVKSLVKRTLSSDKRRNFFVIAAIMLTSFMIASVFSIGFSYYESINMREQRMQGSVSHMAFNAPTEEQLEKIYSLDYVKTVGIGAYVAQTKDFPKLDNLDIAYVDKTQWDEIFCPTFTNIVGRYPEQENEIMLSRYLLDAMGIDEPIIGMEIPISFIVNGEEEVKTETFVLSCIYTEYASVAGNKFFAVYSSRAFAEKAGKLTSDNLSVNVIFKDAKRVGENIEKLKQDLAFSENQQFVQSPAFGVNYGNASTYMTLLIIVVFFMFTGYLLIYNVMYISISKDVRFYGMLKTLGTTPRQIRHIVTGQVARLCVIGLPVGCLASAAVSLLIVPAIVANSGIDTGAVVSFSPQIYIGAVLFAGITAVLGAMTPAKKAANISPVEATKFTGEHIDKMNVYSSANGKPHKMAFRNIFRDRKRAIVVMLSLFLSIMVFISIITVVTSIDIDNYVNAEYNNDYTIEPKGELLTLSEDFINSIKSLDGITEAGVISLGTTEVVHSSALEQIIDFDKENFPCVIRGIDPITFDHINKALPEPIDREAFESGEIALINTQGMKTDENIANALITGSVLYIKNGDVDVPITIGGGSSDSALNSAVGVGTKDTYRLELIVSNTVFPNLFTETKGIAKAFTARLDMNVEHDYDEKIYNALNESIDPAKYNMISRYAARKSMQDSKTIMLVLGGGISLILAFIGIFNFINVMSVGVMVRKREFATLESIGMSKKQVRSMLRSEGMGYAIITILSALTLGNIIAYGLFLLYKNVADYAQFTYPFIPALAVCAAIFLICLITPEVAYKGISKMTLVERLREAE